ncbi:peptidylprolyl isomerase [Stygiobacter electus]|uniref:Peptidylprolyl isomerase n=1 Tax=Stygiobacter electus TaxID=3032292 RepID=A0AAE3NYN5_9BACT|nr:peptidylprolyl isomerase [Stygiobacter electus]MDF1611045.1 peptidylprolyl isomerase [Stygiobacter electus]
MKSLKKLSKINLFIILIILIITSCSKEEQKDKNVIKINDSYLTEEDLKSMLNDQLNRTKLKEELINEWIEDEVLYNEAKKEGILEEKDFQKIMNKSQKKLAIAFLINKIVEDQDFQIKDDEIKKFYDENKNEFKLIDDLYHFKSATFYNYDDAIKFREKLMESNLTISENLLKAQKINYSISENYLYKNEVQPIQLLRILNLLEKDEVSLVIETDDGNFIVVQLIEKLSKNEIPQLDFVYKDVKEKLLLVKQKEFVHNYIKELISEHKLEIERFDE